MVQKTGVEPVPETWRVPMLPLTSLLHKLERVERLSLSHSGFADHSVNFFGTPSYSKKTMML